MNEEWQDLPGVWLADTITKVPDEAKGGVIVSGSHGGRYPGYQAAKFGVRGVIFNDAGGGLEDAGMGSLPYLDALDIAAAVVSHLSCRIADTADMVERGVISHANAAATRLGVRRGQDVRTAAAALRKAVFTPVTPPTFAETRSEIAGAVRRIVLIDSAALVQPQDAGQIVLTGSHGGLVGGNPKMALQVAGYAGVYNDAGVGRDSSGISRLPALNDQGIAGLTVSSVSARIGDAMSAYETGVISHVNEIAAVRGARPGMLLRGLLRTWSENEQ